MIYPTICGSRFSTAGLLDKEDFTYYYTEWEFLSSLNKHGNKICKHRAVTLNSGPKTVGLSLGISCFHIFYICRFQPFISIHSFFK